MTLSSQNDVASFNVSLFHQAKVVKLRQSFGERAISRYPSYVVCRCYTERRYSVAATAFVVLFLNNEKKRKKKSLI